jgi:hypothetical protein
MRNGLLGVAATLNEDRSGARLSAGYWFNEAHTLGVDASFFAVGGRTVTSHFASQGNVLLARPFVNALTGQETAIIIASFAQQEQAAAHSQETNHLWGADADLRFQVLSGVGYCVSLLGGVRHLELDEKLENGVQVALTNPAQMAVNPFVNTSESFADRNYFYGGQVGTDAALWAGLASLQVLSKVAFGVNREVAGIDGSTVRLPGGVLTTQPGGGFALPSNIGRFRRNEFAVVPELGVTLGYQVSRHLNVTIGYSFLYFSNVLRPGELIDRTLNVTQAPPPLGTGVLTGPARPLFPGKDTEFWAQGLNLGVRFSF